MNQTRKLKTPHILLKTMGEVMEKVRGSVVSYWKDHPKELPPPGSSLPPGRAKPFPKWQDMTADDVVIIFSYVLSKTDSRVQGTVALCHFLDDYLEHSKRLAVGRTSLRSWYAMQYMGPNGFALTTLRAALTFLLHTPFEETNSNNNSNSSAGSRRTSYIGSTSTNT